MIRWGQVGGFLNIKKIIFLLIVLAPVLGEVKASPATHTVDPRSGTKHSQKERSKKRVTAYNPRSGVILVSPYRAISSTTEKIPIGLWVTLRKGWHSYWKNPGDIGKSLKATWTLPKGVQLNSLPWPLPERIQSGIVTNFGYKNNFLLISELEILPSTDSTDTSSLLNNKGIKANKKKQSLSLSAIVEWLICKEVCIPLKAKVKLTLPVKDKVQLHPYSSKIFSEWSHKIPQVRDQIILVKKEGDQNTARVVTKQKLKLLDVFPFTASTPTFSPPSLSAVSTASSPSSQMRVLSTSAYEHVILMPKKAKKSLEKALLVFEKTDKPSLQKPSLQKPSLNKPDKSSLKKKTRVGYIYTFKHKGQSLWWFLLLAFLGGVLLNFMPCVLPIVFLKFANTMEQVKQKRSVLIKGHLFYSVGVILSFLFLALLIILLKKGGSAVGWGFQMQSPYFLMSLILLFVFISFGFMGWLKFLSLPLRLPLSFSSVGTSYFKHFLTGVLSTVAASPCTVPFMGTAVGYALLGSAFQVIMIFFFLGLGLSFPYLLLSCWPQGGRYLPTPGKWSEKLKHFMAFPMLGVTAWLIYLFNQNVPDQLFFVLLSLVFLICGLWILKESSSKWFLWVGRGVVIMSLVFPFIQIYKQRQKNQSGLMPAVSLSSQKENKEIAWEVFSLKAMQSAREAGQGVFINFTADWCLTCQWNDWVTFKNKKVRQFFKDSNIRVFKGDWTKKDPNITFVLEQYDRAGVPFYLYFPPSTKGSDGMVLPELLTPQVLFKYLR